MGKMKIKYLLFISIYITIVGADNVGWDSYLIDNPTEFHDLPLVWEFGNDTSVPSWLSGVYVRNGPAQVIYVTSLFDSYQYQYFQALITYIII